MYIIIKRLYLEGVKYEYENFTYYLFVVMLLSTMAIGLFSSYAMESLAIASIRIFAISGIIYSLSDLWRLRGSTSV